MLGQTTERVIITLAAIVAGTVLIITQGAQIEDPIFAAWAVILGYWFGATSPNLPK